MSYSYISFSLPGALSVWEGTDHAIGILGLAGSITQVFISVSDAPSGDDVDVDVRDATGGGGDGITTTILDGTTSKNNTDDSIAVTATDTIYIRVTEGVDALNLQGYFKFEPTGTDDVFAFFTTLDRVKTDEGLSGSTDDAQLSRIIQGVTKEMQSWMGRTIVNTTYTDEVHSGNGWSDSIVLKHRPITSTVTMIVKESDSEISSSLYTSDDDAGIIYPASGYWSSGVWASGIRNYKVTYSAGYATVPEDLAMAATDQVRHQFHQSQPAGENRLGLAQNADASGGSTVYIPGGFLPSVIEAMRPYRRLV